MELHQSHPTDSAPQNDQCSAAPSARLEKPRKKTQIRSCIVNRTEHHKSELFRFCINLKGNLIFDLTQKLPGRGVYVFPTYQNLNTAITKNLFAKALKKQVKIADTFLTQIDAILHQSILDHIGLARRASELIFSAEKIKKYISGNEMGCYLTTSSMNSDTTRTILGHIGSSPVISNISHEDLSNALNLENPVHLALKPGALCDKILTLHTLKITLKAEEKNV